MDFNQNKSRGFIPKRFTPPRVAARMQGVIKNRGIKNVRRNSM